MSQETTIDSNREALHLKSADRPVLPAFHTLIATAPARSAPGVAGKSSLQYNPALDGIRALAVIAVIVFHVSPALLPGGFVGVDVFFVLSGFLVTSIIVKGLREGSFSTREFYLRRIQRLLPNLIVMVLAVLLVAELFLPPSAVRQNARHGVWALFNLSNIYVWRFLGGYWGDSAEYSALTHTWSLGVEEQFYLCFPAFLLLLARVQPARCRFWIALACVSSFGACLYGSYTYPSATFYLLLTRIWELLLGGVLGLYRTPVQDEEQRSQLPTQRRENFALLGFGLVLIGFVLAGADIPFPGWISLFPTVGTALLLLSVTSGQTAVSRFLARPVMVRTGRASYSLYLWHWPLITIGKIEADLHGLPQLPGAAVGCLVAILFAWAAYRFVEQPLRNRGSGRSKRLAIIACGFSCALLLSFTLGVRRVIPDPFHRFDPVKFSGKLYNAGPLPTGDEINAIATCDVIFPPVPPRPAQPWRTGGMIHAYDGALPKVVVLGSSHAMMYSKVIDEICEASHISVAFFGADAGTPAFFEAWSRHTFSSEEEANEFDAARRKYLRLWHPQIVFVIDRWDRAASSAQAFEEKLKSFLGEVSPLAKRVILVTQVPAHRGGDHVNLRELVNWRRSSTALPVLRPDSKETLRREIASIAEAARADFSNLEVLRPDLFFYNQDGSIRYAASRSFFYADDNHLSDAGSEQVRPLFQQAIAQTFGD